MNKRNIIFSLILIVVFAFYYFGNMEKPTSNEKEALIKNKDDINKIEITSKNEAITIEKEGEEWFISQPEKYKADQERVNLILETLPKIYIKDIITDNVDEYAMFDVNEEKGIKVNVYEDNSPTSFIIGKQSSDYLKNYLKKDEKVYLIDQMIKYTFSISLDTIKDKSILDLTDKTITEVEIKIDDKIKSAVLKDGKWYSGENEISNINKLDDILKKLKVSSFKTKEDFEGFNKVNNIEVYLKYSDGKSDQVIFSENEEDKTAFGKSTYNELYFTMTKASLNGIKNFEFE